MQNWDFNDVENWLLVTKQMKTRGEGHPVISLTGADILNMMEDKETMDVLFSTWPALNNTIPPNIIIFKTRVKADKDKNASTWQQESFSPTVPGGPLSHMQHLAPAEQPVPSTPVRTVSVASPTLTPPQPVSSSSSTVLSSGPAYNSNGGDDSDTTEEAEPEEAVIEISAFQHAVNQHVCLYNAVYSTEEAMTTTSNGDSTCSECSQLLKWSNDDGARTVSRHFGSNKHVQSRKKAGKPAITKRPHTAKDVYKIMGDDFFDKFNKTQGS